MDKNPFVKFKDYAFFGALLGVALAILSLKSAEAFIVSAPQDPILAGDITTTEILDGTITGLDINQSTAASTTVFTAGRLVATSTLSLPADSVTDAFVVNALTITGGVINNSPIGSTTAHTGNFTFLGVGTTSPATPASFGTNVYITGGLGVGVATTSAGNLQVTGFSRLGDLEIAGSCNGCGERRAMFTSDYFSGTSWGEPSGRWLQIDPADNINIEVCQGTGCLGNVLGFNNTDTADAALIASTTINNGFIMRASFRYITGAGEGAFCMGVETNGTSGDDGFLGCADQRGTAGVEIRDNSSVIATAATSTSACTNCIMEFFVGTDQSAYVLLWDSSTPKNKGTKASSTAAVSAAAGLSYGLIFDSPDTSAFGFDVWDFSFGGDQMP